MIVKLKSIRAEYKAARAIIKAHAEEHDCKYRITRCGAVDYYGCVSNHQPFWWNRHDDALTFAADIKEGLY